MTIASMTALKTSRADHLRFCEKGGLTLLSQLLRAQPRTAVLLTALQVSQESSQRDTLPRTPCPAQLLKEIYSGSLLHDSSVFHATKLSKLAKLIKSLADTPSGHALQDSTVQAVLQALKRMNEHNKAAKGKKRPRSEEHAAPPPASKSARPSPATASGSGGFGSFAAAGSAHSTAGGFSAATTHESAVPRISGDTAAASSEHGILWTASNKGQRRVRRQQQRRFRWGDGRGDKNTKSAKARDWEAGHGLTQVCMFSDEDAPEAIKQAATGDATTMAAHASAGHSAFAQKRREDSRKDQEAVANLAHTAKDVKRGNLTVAQPWRPPTRLASVTGEPLQALVPPSEEAQYRTELLAEVFKAPAAQQVSTSSETLPATPFITKAEVWKGYLQAHTPQPVRFPQAPNAVPMLHLGKAIAAANAAPAAGSAPGHSHAPSGSAAAAPGATAAVQGVSMVRSLIGRLGVQGGVPNMQFARPLPPPAGGGGHSLLGAPRPPPRAHAGARQSLLGPPR